MIIVIIKEFLLFKDIQQWVRLWILQADQYSFLYAIGEMKMLPNGEDKSQIHGGLLKILKSIKQVQINGNKLNQTF
jgi:hypothetical protein